MSVTDPLLEDLNDRQREAVSAPDGPLLVLAGPGSGKTRVLTHRVAWLIARRRIAPWHIVAVTFTNKAATEMKERLGRLIGETAKSQLAVGTFHSLCARWLRIDGAPLGIGRDFAIYDVDDQQKAIKQALEALELDEKRFRPSAVLATISRAKSELKTPEQYASSTREYYEEAVARIYERYADILARSNALDFDDLLMRTAQLFAQSPSTLEKYQAKFQHILVDEFQDTNPAQYAIVKQLAARHQNIMVVGDPDQSIYAFRSADIRNILNFENDFPQARTILLEQNYRSTQTILDTAQSIIVANRKRKKKTLWTENIEGMPITVFEAYNEQEEADFVVSEIRRLSANGQYRARDCAVMYRTNAQSRALEDAFVKQHLPYRLVGATRFYERREVKDVMAYLRVLSNPADMISLARVINVPPRGIGEKTVANLQMTAAQQSTSLYQVLATFARAEPEPARAKSAGPRRGPAALSDFARLLEELLVARDTLPVTELFDLLLQRTAYGKHLRDGTEEGEDRWGNVMELRTVAEQFADLPPPDGLRGFLEEVALVSEIDNYDPGADASTLLTLHTAKGLEFPVVFIVGLEEGIMPHARSREDPDAMEEERRLFYVGITRAMNRLYFLYAFKRSLYGRTEPSAPSSFLRDIPAKLLQMLNTRTPAAERAPAGSPRVGITTWETPARPERKPRDAGGAQFHAGDKVRHDKFGEGIVITSAVRGDDEEITVIFVGDKPKKLLQSFANLKKR
ncbi:MAG: UvrD-helicase domain-containing protein [Chloroflexi bacterium]|nr:UvrD-helicase domain-containing protein [Chloroflexota bacterium]